MVVVEAMPCGTPVVVAGEEATAELAIDNPTGLHVHVGEPASLVETLE